MHWTTGSCVICSGRIAAFHLATFDHWPDQLGQALHACRCLHTVLYLYGRPLMHVPSEPRIGVNWKHLSLRRRAIYSGFSWDNWRDCFVPGTWLMNKMLLRVFRLGVTGNQTQVSGLSCQCSNHWVYIREDWGAWLAGWLAGWPVIAQHWQLKPATWVWILMTPAISVFSFQSYNYLVTNYSFVSQADMKPPHQTYTVQLVLFGGTKTLWGNNYNYVFSSNKDQRFAVEHNSDLLHSPAQIWFV